MTWVSLGKSVRGGQREFWPGPPQRKREPSPDLECGGKPDAWGIIRNNSGRDTALGCLARGEGLRYWVALSKAAAWRVVAKRRRLGTRFASSAAALHRDGSPRPGFPARRIGACFWPRARS